jgi:uncharacterized metal-binding protein
MGLNNPKQQGTCGCGCSAQPKETVIFTCAGASKNGDITYLAARRLSERGFGRFFCLAGIGAGIEEKKDDAKKADVRIVLDGCAKKCAAGTLKNAGITDNMEIVYSESGLRISGEKPSDREVEEFTDYVVSKIIKK